MKTTAKAVVHLTVELSPTHAAELAELLVRHVDFSDFPWAEAIYLAIERKMDLRDEDVFSDADYGANVFLRRKQPRNESREDETGSSP